MRPHRRPRCSGGGGTSSTTGWGAPGKALEGGSHSSRLSMARGEERRWLIDVSRQRQNLVVGGSGSGACSGRRESRW
jgi:hypothetical protein